VAAHRARREAARLAEREAAVQAAAKTAQLAELDGQIDALLRRRAEVQRW
jgi:hypothetical protein